MTMSSSRPYLIRALYEWIVDNDCTPYILVDTHISDVQVPQEHVNKDGQIVLNINPSAVLNLEMDNDYVSFNARFGGIPTDIYVPSRSILGIYAKENGQGMIFESEPETEPEPEPPKPKMTIPPTGHEPSGAPESAPKKPSLRVVK
jgi:stringent starvation protein B